MRKERLQGEIEGMKVGKWCFSSGLQFFIDFAKIFTIFSIRGFLTIENLYYT